MPTNLHGPQKRTEKRCLKHGCDRETSIVASGLGTHKEKKVCVDIHVQACWVANLLCKIFAGNNEILRWRITFSFLLLGLCLGPVLWSRLGPKSGTSHQKIVLLPVDVLQADRTSMSVSVNTCFFSHLFLVQ